MGSRIGDHLRSNVVGYIAIFLFATGGTAIALDGSNTVFSDDIVNGEVSAKDLGPDSVGSSEVANNSLTAKDLGPDSVGSTEVANNSLNAKDLGKDSVGADEIATGAVGSDEIAYQNPEWAQVDRNMIGSPVAALRAGPYSGPVQPPFGVGSLGLTVGGTEKASFGNEVDFIGDDVSALNQVGFRVFTTQENTKAAPPGTPNMPGIAFEIDPNGAGGTTTNFSSLTWNPATNTAPNVWSAYIDATTSGFWGLTGNAVQLAPDGGELRPERTPLLVRRCPGVPGDRDRGQDSHGRCRQGPGLRLVRCRRRSEDQRHRLRLRAVRDAGRGSVRRRRNAENWPTLASTRTDDAERCADRGRDHGCDRPLSGHGAPTPGQRRKPGTRTVARQTRNGSDGTRTRGLRRDRPAL